MTGSSARTSSVSERPPALGVRDLHVWFCTAAAVADNATLARAVLSHYFGRRPDAWGFRRGENGRPAVIDAPRPLDFNLSDSRDWRVCAVTAGPPVGVDVEYCDPQRDVMKLARRFYHPDEVAALDVCTTAAGRRSRFYDFWTLKEARVKARGAALGPALDSLVFALDFSPAASTGGAPGAIAEAGAPPSTGDQYSLLELEPGYRLATCWRGPAGIPPRLRLFSWHPGAGPYPARRPLRAVSAPIAPRS